MLPIRIQQNGSAPIKAIVFIVILTLLLNGCSVGDQLVGDGRGDWTLSLRNGYAISKINSKEILLIHKKNDSDSNGSIVIPRYFITAYQLQEMFICLKGILTQGMIATEEELENMQLSYFLVNTATGEILGPYESEDEFRELCQLFSIKISDRWETPHNPDFSE